MSNKIDIKYINKDYLTILEEFMTLMQDNNSGLTSAWSNMSQADPMFTLLHLYAAHADNMNYMLDYRLNESFMTTAKERASVVRIANSNGFKIPSYRAGSSRYKITNPTTGTITIPNFTTFYNTSSNLYYTLITEDGEALDVDVTDAEQNNFVLYQGVTETHTFDPVTISEITKTHIISNQAISISAARSSAISLSTLTNGATKFKEVNNLTEYIGEDLHVYELNVDPQGITYIRFHKLLNLVNFPNDFILTYIVTLGNHSGVPETLETGDSLDNNGDSINITVEIIPNTTTPGQDPMSVEDIRQAFATYNVKSETLQNENGIRRFIMTEQDIYPVGPDGIVKCEVFSKANATIFDTTELTRYALQDLQVYIVLYGANNNPLTVAGNSRLIALKEAIDNKLFVPLTVSINEPLNEAAGANLLIPLLKLNISLQLNLRVIGGGTISFSVSTQIKETVAEYINSNYRPGEYVYGQDILNYLREAYPQYTSSGVFIQNKETTAPFATGLFIDVNRVANIDNYNTDITI